MPKGFLFGAQQSDANLDESVSAKKTVTTSAQRHHLPQDTA